MKCRKRILTTMLLFSLVTGTALQPVYANENSREEPVRICTHESQPETFCQDITGDGEDDAIQVSIPYNEEMYCCEKLEVFVNGKSVLLEPELYGFYSVDIEYFSMGNSLNFLQIMGVSDNDYLSFNNLYYYDTAGETLVKVLDLYEESYGTALGVSSVSEDEILVNHALQPQETGRIGWQLCYVWQDGRFHLKSDTAEVHSLLGDFTYPGDGYEQYFAKNQYVVSNPPAFYEDTALEKAAFTAEKGDILNLLNIKVSAGQFYLQFEKEGLTGWQRVNSMEFIYDLDSGLPVSETGWFYGVHDRLAG